MNNSSMVRLRSDCRLCGSTDLVAAFSFGETPLANAYVSADDLNKHEIFAPLVVNMCNTCKLVQLRDVVNPKVLFSNYLYVSGTSPVFVAHFAKYAKDIVNRFGLSDKSLVVDAGSNDGTLLQQFKNEGTRVLGIDPAENLAIEATKNGIPTIAKFFTSETAREVNTKHGKASIITANNVFAHTDDVVGFLESIKELLLPDGVFIFEVQYLKDLIEQNLFDMIYHEHLCYYHITPLVPFFEKTGLRVFDVEHVATHGGSIRVYVGWDDSPHRTSENVASMLSEESELNTASTYREFAERIDAIGNKLRSLLEDFRREGKRVVGYGAPAKATTLCYALGIDGKTLEYIVDDSPLKQGLHMPGTHIPIKAPDTLYTDKPDACLILAWNFADSIIKNHKKFSKQGGVFIIPVPEPRILS
jgi:SAM-dependent methyltransferase